MRRKKQASKAKPKKASRTEASKEQLQLQPVSSKAGSGRKQRGAATGWQASRHAPPLPPLRRRRRADLPGTGGGGAGLTVGSSPHTGSDGAAPRIDRHRHPGHHFLAPAAHSGARRSRLLAGYRRPRRCKFGPSDWSHSR